MVTCEVEQPPSRSTRKAALFFRLPLLCSTLPTGYSIYGSPDCLLVVHFIWSLIFSSSASLSQSTFDNSSKSSVLTAFTSANNTQSVQNSEHTNWVAASRCFSDVATLVKWCESAWDTLIGGFTCRFSQQSRNCNQSRGMWQPISYNWLAPYTTNLSIDLLSKCDYCRFTSR